MVSCGVCWTEGLTEVGKITSCGHGFCWDCLLRWSALANICPLCRTRFNVVRRIQLNLQELPDSDEEGVVDRYPGVILEEQPVPERDLPPNHIDDTPDPMEAVFCMVCDRGDDEDSMLLCDGCERGFHTWCVNLAGVPEGDWFCDECLRGAAGHPRGTRTTRGRPRLRGGPAAADTILPAPAARPAVRQTILSRRVRRQRRVEEVSPAVMLQILDAQEARQSANAASSHAHRAVDELRESWERVRRGSLDFGPAGASRAAPQEVSASAGRPSRADSRINSSGEAGGAHSDSEASERDAMPLAEILRRRRRETPSPPARRRAAGEASARTRGSGELTASEMRAQLAEARERGLALGPSGRLDPKPSTLHRPDLPQARRAPPPSAPRTSTAGQSVPRAYQPPTRRRRWPSALSEASRESRSPQRRERSPSQDPWSPPRGSAVGWGRMGQPTRLPAVPNRERRPVSEFYGRSFGVQVPGQKKDSFLSAPSRPLCCAAWRDRSPTRGVTAASPAHLVAGPGEARSIAQGLEGPPGVEQRQVASHEPPRAWFGKLPAGFLKHAGSDIGGGGLGMGRSGSPAWPAHLLGHAAPLDRGNGPPAATGGHCGERGSSPCRPQLEVDRAQERSLLLSVVVQAAGVSAWGQEQENQAGAGLGSAGTSAGSGASARVPSSNPRAEARSARPQADAAPAGASSGRPHSPVRGPGGQNSVPCLRTSAAAEGPSRSSMLGCAREARSGAGPPASAALQPRLREALDRGAGVSPQPAERRSREAAPATLAGPLPPRPPPPSGLPHVAFGEGPHAGGIVSQPEERSADGVGPSCGASERWGSGAVAVRGHASSEGGRATSRLKAVQLARGVESLEERGPSAVCDSGQSSNCPVVAMAGKRERVARYQDGSQHAKRPRLSKDEQAKQLKAAKERAAGQVKEVLKPMLADGRVTREQFKAVARAATGALYRQLQWTQDDVRRQVQAELEKV
eukprot:jgi/Botrbrau1/9578/Bobra.106_2s0004.2